MSWSQIRISKVAWMDPMPTVPGAPLLVYPKLGQTCNRFKDAPGLNCNVDLGLGFPKIRALCVQKAEHLHACGDSLWPAAA